MFIAITFLSVIVIILSVLFFALLTEARSLRRRLTSAIENQNNNKNKKRKIMRCVRVWGGRDGNWDYEDVSNVTMEGKKITMKHKGISITISEAVGYREFAKIMGGKE